MTRLLPFTVAIMIFFVALVVIIPHQAATFDSPTSIERLAIEQLDGSLRFYNVDNSGKFTLLIELNEFGFRSAYSYSYHRWDIFSPSSIVISPDGQRFAFAAVRDLEPETTTLFIYTIGDSNVQEVPIPGLASLRWSPLAPNYDAILLAPPDPYLVLEMVLRLDGLYLYNLVSDDLSKITYPAYYRSIDWLPNGHQIIASRLESRCESPCVFSDDLYITDLDGSLGPRLTDIAFRLLLDIPDFWLDSCYIQKPTWSAINKRFYFTVDCRFSGYDISHDVVYSVDLIGNTRLEVNLLTEYSEDWYINVSRIYPSSDSEDVYVVASGKIRDESDGYDTETWRVYRITSAGQSEMVAELKDVSSAIRATALSPDEKWLAVGGASSGVHLSLVNLITGEVLPQQFMYMQNSVFELDWLDNEHLLVSEFIYITEQGYEPFAVWILDIATGHRTNVTADMEGLVWIIRKRDTPSIR